VCLGVFTIDTRVGYIGLGTMGRPMAANVARRGHALVVYDVRAEACVPLQALGAEVVTTPREVAERCDVVLINVVTDAQVRTVVLGEDGVLGALPPKASVVVHSTIDPRTCRELEEAALEHDVGFLDAPFSGGAAAAETGSLTLMVGGAASVLETCRPVLAAMADAIFHVGGAGMGEAAKIVNNAVLAVVLEATNEGLALSNASGVDDDVMLSILCSSAGDSWAARNWRAIEQVVATYPGGPRGLADLVTKDLRLALAIAHDVGIAVPAVALTTQFAEAPYHRRGDNARAS
jgi:3-hydroxyisobutyrate dehydrogenase-like beta-hydroxyacid dehydrogenase